MEVFTDSFLRQPLIALVICGAVCGYLGIFVVLRRTVFLGAALAEVSSAGIATAILAGVNPMLGSLSFVVAGVAAFSARPSRRQLPQEASVGVGYALAAAMAVLLIHLGTGEAHMLDVLTGNIIGVEATDLWVALAVFAGVMGVHALCFKEFLFTSFDPETAASQGYHTRLWDALLFLTVGIAVATSIRLVGTLVTFAYLVVPAVSALGVCRSLRTAIATIPFVGVLPAVVGYYLSYRLDLPTGATVTTVMVVLLCVILAGKWVVQQNVSRVAGCR